MSKKNLNISGLFSSDPLPEAEPTPVATAPAAVETVVAAKPEPSPEPVAPVAEVEVVKTPKKAAKAAETVADNTPPAMLPDLDSIRKKKPVEYISFKLRRDLHNKLTKIAKKENIDHTGNLVHLVLEDFVKKYGEG